MPKAQAQDHAWPQDACLRPGSAKPDIPPMAKTLTKRPGSSCPWPVLAPRSDPARTGLCRAELPQPLSRTNCSWSITHAALRSHAGGQPGCVECAYHGSDQLSAGSDPACCMCEPAFKAGKQPETQVQDVWYCFLPLGRSGCGGVDVAA